MVLCRYHNTIQVLLEYSSQISVPIPNPESLTHWTHGKLCWVFFANLLLISFTFCLRPPFGTLEHLAERWSNWTLTFITKSFSTASSKGSGNTSSHIPFYFVFDEIVFFLISSSRVKKFFRSRGTCVRVCVRSAQVIHDWIQSRSSQQAQHLSGINNITDLQEQPLKRKTPPTTVLKDASFRPIVLVTAQPMATHHPLGLLVSNRTKVVETTSATATKEGQRATNLLFTSSGSNAAEA